MTEVSTGGPSVWRAPSTEGNFDRDSERELVILRRPHCDTLKTPTEYVYDTKGGPRGPCE